MKDWMIVIVAWLGAFAAIGWLLFVIGRGDHRYQQRRLAYFQLGLAEVAEIDHRAFCTGVRNGNSVVVEVP
jgi:hypothetical protein